MNAAPRGSKHAKKEKEIKSDPAKNLNWEAAVPFVAALTKESKENVWYHFIKGEWTYLNHKTDLNKPAGVIEGGPSNYSGLGLKLKRGKDRQREKKFHYFYDHGVEWRQNLHGNVLKLDLHPDGCQDVYLGETDEMMEDRQWGSWSPDCGTTHLFPSTGWRSFHPAHDLTELPTAWTHKPNHVNQFPLNVRVPPPGPQLPNTLWELAARGMFGGWMNSSDVTRNDDYNEMKGLLTEYEEDEKEAEANKNKIVNLKRKSRIWKMFESHNRKLKPEEKKYNEIYLRRIMNLLKLQYLDKNSDIDYITNVISRKEAYDHLGGGNAYCTESEINQKTIALNLSIYAYKDFQNTYYESLSADEMSEMYHYTMTEHRKHALNEDNSNVVLKDYKAYDLEFQRKKFEVLDSFYRPSRTHKKYGEEFGDALKKKEWAKKAYLRNIDQEIHFEPSKNSTDEEEANFISEYSFFH